MLACRGTRRPVPDSAGLLGGNLPSLMPAVAGPTVGNERNGSGQRYDGGGRLGDSGGADNDRHALISSQCVSISARRHS